MRHLSPKARWEQVGPSLIENGHAVNEERVPVSGRITNIVTHPRHRDVLFVGTARGGVWRSTDGGKRWAPTTEDAPCLAIGALAIAPSHPEVLYAGTGEGNIQFASLLLADDPTATGTTPESYFGSGILKTSDNAGTWRLTGGRTFSNAAFYRIAVHPGHPEIVFAASSFGLHRSLNGGITWEPVTNGLPAISRRVIAATDVAFDPHDANWIYVAFFSGGIFRTRNSVAPASNWEKIAQPAGVNRFGRVTLALDPSDVHVYAMFGDAVAVPYNVIGVFRLNPRAINPKWETIIFDDAADYLRSQSPYNAALAVDPATSDTVYAGAERLWVFHRAAGKVSWEPEEVGRSVHEDHHSVAFDASRTRLFVGTDGGIFGSTDRGRTFTSLNDGLCIAEVQTIAQHPQHVSILFCGTHDNGALYFHNSTRARVVDDGDVGAIVLDNTNGANVFLSKYTGPERSTSGGMYDTFFDIGSGLRGSAAYYPPLAMDPTNQKNLAYGAQPYLLIDDAQGTGGWRTCLTLPKVCGAIISIHFVNSELIFVGTTAGEVYRARRRGRDWSGADVIPIHTWPLPKGKWVHALRARAADGTEVVAALSGYGNPHVWHANIPSSGRVKWTSLDGAAPHALPDVPANAIAIDPTQRDRIFVGTNNGVYVTDDGGYGWKRFSNGLPNTVINDLQFHPKARLLRAATGGRGIWQCRS